MIASRRMSDVAAAAGVSVSTVSNALNCRQKVKTETQVRILATIDRLGYVRNEQAHELSKGARTSSRKHRGTGEPQRTPDAVPGEPDVGIFGGIEVLGSSLLVQLLVGNYVGLISRDPMIAKGWMDMVSADGTTAWVWLDSGGGHRMVHAGDGIGLMVLEEAPAVGHTHETTNKNRKCETTTEGN